MGKKDKRKEKQEQERWARFDASYRIGDPSHPNTDPPKKLQKLPKSARKRKKMG